MNNTTIIQKAEKARFAAIKMSALDGKTREDALEAIAIALLENKDTIIKANEIDLENGKKNNIADPLLKRLKFDETKLDDVVYGIRSLIKIEDLIGKVIEKRELSKDLTLYKKSCSIGVVSIIFESRPDALVQISSLCLKSGNSVLLKGGSEAMNTNKALFDVIYSAAIASGIPEGFAALMESRADVGEMLKLDGLIDLIIPRGSNSFVKYIMDNSNIPVMGHADGICHTYVDASADVEKSIKVCVDAKAQYVSVCNATETLLVHKDIAKDFLPKLVKSMQSANVKLLGCKRTLEIVDIDKASDDDWDIEYLDYILSIKIVNDLNEAIDHINIHGSKHTDAILSQDKIAIEIFCALVDSAGVYVNASTRFADGFVYGFGAEVGISTSKLHARGPVGIDGLMTYKYILEGDYDCISSYKSGEKEYNH